MPPRGLSCTQKNTPPPRLLGPSTRTQNRSCLSTPFSLPSGSAVDLVSFGWRQLLLFFVVPLQQGYTQFRLFRRLISSLTSSPLLTNLGEPGFILISLLKLCSSISILKFLLSLESNDLLLASCPVTSFSCSALVPVTHSCSALESNFFSYFNLSWKCSSSRSSW